MDVSKKRAAVVVAAICAGLLAPAAANSDLRLIDAVKHQDRAAIATLMKERVDVNATQPDGTTALHWAAYRDDAATVDALVRGGVKANAVTDAGVTPLWLACTTNAGARVVRLLLDAGANPNLAPNTGETPLMWCARTGALDSVKALVSRGANVHARGGVPRRRATVRPLIRAGAKVNAVTDRGITPLWVACSTNSSAAQTIQLCSTPAPTRTWRRTPARRR